MWSLQWFSVTQCELQFLLLKWKLSPNKPDVSPCFKLSNPGGGGCDLHGFLSTTHYHLNNTRVEQTKGRRWEQVASVTYLQSCTLCLLSWNSARQVVTRRLKSSFCCDLYGPPCFLSWSGIDHLSPAWVNRCPLTWSMMGEMAAELTGLSVLKVLMWSRDEQSNSWKEMGK